MGDVCRTGIFVRRRTKQATKRRWVRKKVPLGDAESLLSRAHIHVWLLLLPGAATVAEWIGTGIAEAGLWRLDRYNRI